MVDGTGGGGEPGIKICLASSGGGHLRQLLQLRPVYETRNHFFVVPRTPLSESIRKNGERCYHVPDTALGKLSRNPLSWCCLVGNIIRSLLILVQERPNVVLSAGAGAAFPILFLANWLRTRIVFVETLAHSRTPSQTGRRVSQWADLYLVQWKSLNNSCPDAVVAETIHETGEGVPDPPVDRKQVFVTVGTHAPFDRLIREVERLVAEGKIQGPVYAQVGKGGYRPRGIESRETCTPEEIRSHLEKSHLAITHAGTGSILSALEADCRVIAVPRKADEGEHYDDHQEEFLMELVERGAILGALDVSELENVLSELPHFHPRRIRYTTEPLISTIEEKLAEWFGVHKSHCDDVPGSGGGTKGESTEEALGIEESTT